MYTEEADQEGLSADNALKAHATCGFDRNVAKVDGRDNALKARRARIFEDFKNQGLYEAYFGIRKPRRKSKLSAAGKQKEEAPRTAKAVEKKQARPQMSVEAQSAAGKPDGSSTKRRSGIAAIKALLVKFPYVPPPPMPEKAQATTTNAMKKEKKAGAAVAVRGAIGAADEAMMGTSHRRGNASAAPAATGKAKGKGKGKK